MLQFRTRSAGGPRRSPGPTCGAVTALAAVALLATGGRLESAAPAHRSAATPTFPLAAPRQLVPSQLQPPDRAVRARIDTTLAWYRDALIRGYFQHGRLDARWDATVKTALSLVARSWALDPDGAADTDDQAWYGLRRAVALGCDDPLVVFLAAWYDAADLDAATAARRTVDAASALRASDHDAALRGLALMTAADRLLHAAGAERHDVLAEPRPSAAALVASATELLPAVAGDRALPAGLLVRYLTQLWHVSVDHLREDRLASFVATFSIVETARDSRDAVLPLLRARFYANGAGDARRAPDAAAGPGGGATDWPAYFTRLERAEAEAARAVALGSIDPEIAVVMTDVARGLHQNRRELEAWFAIGRRLDPGSLVWHRAKLDWISGRWYGSDDEVLAFAREVRRAGEWGSRAPMVLLEAHAEAAHGDERYFERREVCDEIQWLYDELLTRHPEAGSDRGQYARRLAACGRWNEAHRQFQLLAPDRVRVGVFGGQAAYDAARKEAAVRATPLTASR